MTAKKMLPGQQRFVTRVIDKLWRVYDRGNASYPYQTDELGKVVQDVSEEEAQAEAKRLEALTSKKQGADKRSSKTVQLEEVEVDDAAGAATADLEEFEVEEYEMSEDQKKKHEEEVLSGKY